MAASPRAICRRWYRGSRRLRTNLQLAAFALIVGALAPGLAAHAQAPAAADGQRAQARRHFEAGAEHYAARRFREAIREFGQAAALMPSAELWFDIARAHEALGEHEQAIEHYELYLRDRVDAPDAEEVHARIHDLRRARQRAARADASTKALLRIDVDRDDAIVMLDARSVGRSPLPQLLEIAPGRHRLDVTHPGHLPFRAAVDVQAGSLTAAFVELTPRRSARDGRGGERLWTWVAAAGAGASLLASATIGALAVSSKSDDDFDAARDRAQASDVLLGSGLVLGVTALVLYGLEGEAATPR
jgi:tetratricopeptide (TPR) repeat protein